MRRDQLGRVPAADVETLVLDAVRRVRETEASSDDAVAPLDDRRSIEIHLEKVVVRKSQLEITLSDSEPGSELLLIEWTPPPTRVGREIIVPSGHGDAQARPLRWAMRARLVEA